MRNLIYFMLPMLMVISACKTGKDNTDVIKTGVLSYACLPQGLETGIIVFYPFSKGSLNDLSGNNALLINNTKARPAADRFGNTDCAYRFDNRNGDSQFVAAGSVPALSGLKKMSISLWYQPLDSSRGDGKLEMLMTRKGLAPDKYNWGAWSFVLHDCSKAVFGSSNMSVWEKDLLWDKNNPSSMPSCADEIQIRMGKWHHAAITYDDDIKHVRLYINGKLQDATNERIIDFSVSNSGALTLGHTFTGCIDDVLIYNKVLSQQEVLRLYQASGCCEK